MDRLKLGLIKLWGNITSIRTMDGAAVEGKGRRRSAQSG
jgi:hypothetical protein